MEWWGGGTKCSREINFLGSAEYEVSMKYPVQYRSENERGRNEIAGDNAD